MNNLTCRNCDNEYDTTKRRPIILTACGHTFCRYCIQKKLKASWTRTFNCPIDKKEYRLAKISDFPVNKELEILLGQKSSNKCSEHNNVFEFYCLTCK